MVDPKKMSIEEMLNHCRQVDGDGEAETPAAASSEPETTAPEPAAEAPTPTAPAKPADAGAMSTADILAMARSGDSGGGAKASEPTEEAAAPAKPVDRAKMSVEEMLAAARGADKPGAKAAAKKPAAKKPAAKGGAKPAAKAKAAKKPAAATHAGPKDTASILAAARSAAGAKPGPISKAEAAARAKADPTKGKKKVVAPPMPEKPAYARRPEPTAQGATDRRGFVATVMGAFLGSSMAVGFSSLAVTHILWVLGLARFMFPNILTEPPTQFKVGFPTDYAFGQVQTKFKAQFGVWIVQYEYQGEQQIYALKAVCTHLGCTPNWLDGEQKFKCPCHGSGFYKDGVNFEGPAPRPLERYAIRISDDGQLEVDKSRKFNEELGQWSDSACYVTV